MAREKKPTLTYDESVYNPYVLREIQPLTEKEMRQEYARLRRIANKRLANIGKSEFKDTKTYQYNAGKFDKPSSKLSYPELVYKLSDVARFLTQKTSTLTGLKEHRKKSLESLHEHGYTFVNESNFKAFTEFMDEWRTRKLSQTYDSERVAELFEIAEEKMIDPNELFENFDTWYNNAQKLKNYERITNKNRRVTSGDYWRAMGL